MPGRESEIFDNLQACEYIFLVVNPTSGGNAAQYLLDLGFNYLHCTHHVDGLNGGPKTQVKLLISDIRKGTTGNKDVFHILKAIVQLKNPTDIPQIRLLVAGGDGTAMWAISELLKHNIDPDKLIVGVLPFGTGNDFAHAMGSHIHCKMPSDDPLTL